jgi:TRAP-type C4-dicarboxylate transport system permease small subunit
MLLDKKRDREIAERQRRTKSTLFQVVWLVLATAVAAGVTYFIFTNDILTTAQFYALGLPREVPEWAIYLGVGFALLVVMQLLFSLGYLIASPKGRRKAGTPTLESSTMDPTSKFDD